jgi:hypothetical protein
MGIRINQGEARRQLGEALAWARSAREVPADWLGFSEAVFNYEYKTYTPALGAALLARATDVRIDPLSIKASYGQNTYSLRTVGNGILVPAAVAEGFSIRTTGREPLNNQPFFRYDHMSEIEKVRSKATLMSFLAGLRQLETADSDDALAGLAAFLRHGFEVAAARRSFAVAAGPAGLDQTNERVNRFLDEAVSERPKRVQALVAAAFDTGHDDVRSRKINDPSRDLPGDVQAYYEDKPIAAAEARGKAVPETEVTAFARACADAEIDRAYIVALWPKHKPIDRSIYERVLVSDGVVLNAIETPLELLRSAIDWSGTSAAEALQNFAFSTLERLKEIECSEATLEEWVALTSASDD